ncbi:hypothetical protein NEUTE2DRAFT_62791, partial [Neurospora tetrasperma FGSC 2509]
IINYLFINFVNSSIFVYFNNILIYANIKEEYNCLVLEVLKRLINNYFAIAP